MFGNLFLKNKRNNKYLYSEKIDINSENKSSLSSTNNSDNQLNGKNQLPQNFAQELFDLEMDVEGESIDIVTITKLLQLYAIAIEYYESIKSNRYLIFKNKTQALLLKANVQESMDRAQHRDTSQDQENEQNCQARTKKQKIQQRQKEIELNMKYIKQQDNQENVKIILHNHNSSFEHNSNIINKEINEQKNLILKRLEMRKKSLRLKTQEIDNNDKENYSPKLRNDITGTQSSRSSNSKSSLTLNQENQ